MRTSLFSVLAAVLVLLPVLPVEAEIGVDLSADAAASAQTEIISVTREYLETSIEADATIGSSADASVEWTEMSSQNDTGASLNTSTEVRAHARAIAKEDDRVSSIELSSKNVTFSYRERANLFGFIEVNVPVIVSVEADGEVSVTYPWYSFMLSTNRAGLAIRAEAAARNTLGVNASSEETLSAEEQVHLATALHAALRAEASAAISADTKAP
jgi:hypothetical protein